MIQIVDTTIYLTNSKFIFLAIINVIHFRIKTITSTITIKIKGSRASKNDLNKRLEGVKTLISLSLMKQSNENSVSFGDPTFSNWVNIVVKVEGISISNDIDRDIICK